MDIPTPSNPSSDRTTRTIYAFSTNPPSANQSTWPQAQHVRGHRAFARPVETHERRAARIEQRVALEEPRAAAMRAGDLATRHEIAIASFPAPRRLCEFGKEPHDTSPFGHAGNPGRRPLAGFSALHRERDRTSPPWTRVGFVLLNPSMRADGHRKPALCSSLPRRTSCAPREIAEPSPTPALRTPKPLGSALSGRTAKVIKAIPCDKAGMRPDAHANAYVTQVKLLSLSRIPPGGVGV